MTGPEHYREAERLLDEAADTSTNEAEAAIATRAQAHATLALAAATAVKSPTDGHAWVEVAGTKLSCGS